MQRHLLRRLRHNDTGATKRGLEPAWRRATRLCAVLAVAGCASERSPWNGFALFPEPSDAGAGPTTAEPAPGVQSPAAVSGAGARWPSVTVGGSRPAAGMPAMSAGGTGAPVTEGPTAPAGAPGTVPAQPQLQGAFRITELYLRDPHIFVGISDITDSPVLGMSVNRSLIPDQIRKDADKDGFLDASLVLQLTAGVASAAVPGAQLNMFTANCPASLSGPCKPAAGLAVSWSLSPLAMTTSAYQPPVGAPSGPCFVTSNANDIIMDLGGIKIPVAAARVAATYQMQPKAALTQGLIAGFVTNAAAMAAIVPSDAGPPVGGSSLSMFVRQRDHDQAASPMMQDGFWMYMNFVAEPVPFEQP
jgi:hypothetical protein